MSDSARTCAFCHGQFWDRPGVTHEDTVWGPTEESRPVPYWFCDDRCRQHWLDRGEQYDGQVAAVNVDLERFGGLLRCGECGREQALGDTASHLRDGWPMCCSYTMRWLTQRELDAEQYDGEANG